MTATPHPWRLRPSAAPIWVKCNGSVALSVPELETDEDDNEIREDGTACHWAAHEHALGRPVAEGTIAPNGPEIDADMLDAVAMYHAAIRQWGAHAYFEQPVHCFGVHPDCGGTPDAFAYDPTSWTLYIADLKYGFRFVDAFEAWQLLCYADGAARYLGVTPRRYVLTIVQPRAHGPHGYVRTWEIDAAQFAVYLEVLSRAARAALSPNAQCTINPGCRNCSGRFRCPTLTRAAGAIMDASYDALPHELTFEQQEATLHQIHYAQGLLKAYETGLAEQVSHGIKSGKISRYFEITRGTTPMRWDADALEQVKTAAAIMGVNINKEPQLITPTQATKLLGASVVSMYARRHQKPAALRPTDAELWKRIFNK